MKALVFYLLFLISACLVSCKESADQSSDPTSTAPQEDLDCKKAGEEIIYHSQLHLDGTWNKLMTVLTYNIWRLVPEGVPAPITEYTNLQHSRFPRSSPSGKYLIYTSTGALDGQDISPMGINNLWVSTRDGKRKWPVTKNSKAGLATFWGLITPDDKKVIFFSNLNLNGKWDEPANASANLWVIDREGKDLPHAITQNLTLNTDSIISAISPDGKWILGRSYMNLTGEFNAKPVLSPNMWMFSIDGKVRYPITKNTLVGLNSSGGHFFPDGSRVAFISVMSLTGVFDAPKNLAWTIWSAKTDGTDLKLVAGGPKMGFYFSAISNDGKTIYGASPRSFDGVSADNLSANLWAINSDGSGMNPLTFNKKANLSSYSPRLSPSGEELVFISTSDLTGKWDGVSSVSYNIWKMKVDGTQRQPLTLTSHALLDTNIDMPPDWLPATKCN